MHNSHPNVIDSPLVDLHIIDKIELYFTNIDILENYPMLIQTNRNISTISNRNQMHIYEKIELEVVSNLYIVYFTKTTFLC